MSLERVLVWATVLAAGSVAVLVTLAPPTPPAQLVVAALGALVVFPVAFVAVGWLYSVGVCRRRH